MKALAIFTAALLLLALLALPIGYYAFLRIATTIAAIIIILDCFCGKMPFWTIGFGITAIVFNPFIPVYLYQKDKWMPIDIGAALLFLAYGFFYKVPEKQKQQ